MEKIIAWAKNHRTAVMAIAGGLLIIGWGSSAAYMLTRPMPEIKLEVIDVRPKPKPVYHSPLTGKVVSKESDMSRPVTAVMIENSPDARPQSGLKESGVVFEAVAEGGVTRFMALYQNENPKLIGPVRSLRPYFIDWLAPHDASIAHVGGSWKALKQIRNGSYRDIDQFFNSGTYWRSNDRYAPHNVYTTMKRLNKLNRKKGYKSSSFTGLARKDSQAAKEPTTKKFSINISGSSYDTRYSYNAKSNTYRRFMGGEKHLDREKGQISPRVVVALMVNEKTVDEDGARESIKTSGTGKAYIFQDGIRKQATWHKKNRKGQYIFTDKNGKDVSLARGQTWITAVPNGKGSVTW